MKHLFKKGNKINLGRKLTKEHKKKISQALKGRPQLWNIGKSLEEWNKFKSGKTYEEIYGEKKAKQAKEKLRLLGKKNKGRIHSIQSRKNMSKAHIGK